MDRVIHTSDHEIKLDDLNLLISLAFKLDDKKDEQAIDDFLSKVDLKVKNANDYVEFAKDLKNEFNYRGLVLSILFYVFQIEVGKDEKDQIVINKVEDKNSDKIQFIKLRLRLLHGYWNRLKVIKKIKVSLNNNAKRQSSLKRC